MFTLNPQLEKDSELLGHLKLCQVRLMNNACFPWLLLIPQQNGLSELFDLSDTQQIILQQEIILISKVLKTLTICDKINTAALGNVVSQLHVHVIARFKGDAAWPKPVWGNLAKPYENLAATVAEWKSKLQGIIHE